LYVMAGVYVDHPSIATGLEDVMTPLEDATPRAEYTPLALMRDQPGVFRQRAV
jgi:hypothetical protein